ncbi:replication initiation protein [Metabacillus fastidiosus]|uniref:replication initiation protein n=1 Tax=Metabacillus fastidiosus TaxID=1458 RepID=UPI002E1F2301|nr:replication initiation protein [Metabacillus fastidiosus]
MKKNEIVVKSNQLIEAKYKLSVREQKIILYLISQISLNDEEFKMYRLSIKAFCEMMDLKGSPKYKEIKDITDGLQQKLLKIRSEGKVYSVTWLSLVVYNENEGTIDMRFDPFLKPFLLQLKKEFTKFELKNVLHLKSSNTIRLYELLKQYSTIGERQFRIDELKEYMGIGKDGYKKYTDFKRKVILAAEKEINEKTDITFYFKEIKKGRSVASLHFFVKPKTKTIEDKAAEAVNEEIDDWFESLFVQLELLFKKHDYTLGREVLKRWVEAAHKIWEENKYIEVNKLSQQCFRMDHINNHIAFITYILNEKCKCIENGTSHHHISVETVSKKTIRKELLPDWFEDYKIEKKEQPNEIDTYLPNKGLGNLLENFEEELKK